LSKNTTSDLIFFLLCFSILIHIVEEYHLCSYLLPIFLITPLIPCPISILVTYFIFSLTLI
jgi:hypothetical protein